MNAYQQQQALNRAEDKYLDPPDPDRPDEEEFEDPIDYYEEAQLRKYDREKDEGKRHGTF